MSAKQPQHGRHGLSAHSLDRLVRCSDCGRTFGGEDGLRYHDILYLCEGPENLARIGKLVKSEQRAAYRTRRKRKASNVKVSASRATDSQPETAA